MTFGIKGEKLDPKGVVCTGTDGTTFVEDSYRSNHGTHKDDFGQY